MENSSKALLIAAAILIVILLLTISIKILTSPKDVTKQGESVGEMIASTAKDISQQIEGSFDIQREPGTSGSTGGIIDDEIGGINNNEDFSNAYIPTTWTDNGDGTFSKGTTKVKIGDYVNYTYDTVSTGYPLAKAYSGSYTSDQTITQSAGLQWRVMGVSDSGELELISDKPTSKVVGFMGATGYNNGVFLLNDICKSQYSNSSLGIEARSLTIEDIEERFSDAGKSARDGYTNSYSGIQYGKTKTYGSGDNMYPTLYAEEANSGVAGSIREGGIGGSDPFYKNKESLSVSSTSKSTASGNLMTTQTSYYWSSTPASYFDNETFRNMIFRTETSYWLASRYVKCISSRAGFGLRYVKSASLSVDDLFYSNNSSHINYHSLCPVVSLKSNISLTGTGDNIGSVDNMWQIS